MKEHPILFSTPMVQAIRAGRKVQTRRIIKESFNGCLTNGGPHPCPNEPIVYTPGERLDLGDDNDVIIVEYPQVRALFHCSTLDSEAKCPFGKVGDLLWVKETMRFNKNSRTYWPVADGYIITDKSYEKTIPSIFMPKRECRTWLQVVNIRVEALNDISEEDAMKEGVNPVTGMTAKEIFECVWDSINGYGSWHQNPWVWVIEFKAIERVSAD